MTGGVRPLSPTREEVDPKRSRTSNEKEEALPEPDIKSPSIPFPDLLHARTGIESVASEPRIKSSKDISENMNTLIEALKKEEVQVDELDATHIADKFFATPEVQAMFAMRQLLPTHCPSFIPRYFALEQKGAANLTSLSSKVTTYGVGLNEIPLLRFLPLCTNLQKLKVEIEISNEDLYIETITTLTKLLHKSKKIEEFELVLKKDSPDRVIECEGEIFTDILTELLRGLLELPNMKTIQMTSLIPEYTLIAEIHESYHDELVGQLNDKQKNRCKIILSEDKRKELRKFLSRSELDKGLRILPFFITSGAHKGSLSALSELVPEILDSNQQIDLEELTIYFSERGNIHCGFWENRNNKIDSQRLPSPSDAITEGYLDLIYES